MLRTGQFSYAYDAHIRNSVTTAGAKDIYDAHDYGASIDYPPILSKTSWPASRSRMLARILSAYTGIEITAKAIWSDSRTSYRSQPTGSATPLISASPPKSPSPRAKQGLLVEERHQTGYDAMVP